MHAESFYDFINQCVAAISDAIRAIKGFIESFFGIMQEKSTEK